MLNRVEHEKSFITSGPGEESTYSEDDFYTPPHNSGGVLWFHVGRPCVRLSMCLSIFRFRMIT